MAHDLVRILKAEAEALLSGDFTALDELGKARDAALRSLDDQDDLESIRRLAERNMHLARAARAGVERARLRLHQALGGASFDTYARDGQRSSYAELRPSLQRRA